MPLHAYLKVRHVLNLYDKILSGKLHFDILIYLLVN
jgi:hypothetical protein